MLLETRDRRSSAARSHPGGRSKVPQRRATCAGDTDRPGPRPGARPVPVCASRPHGAASFLRRPLRSSRKQRRPMVRPDKAAAVAELVDSFQEASGAVLTEYRGLTVKQLQDLRRALGENANYAVVKNTLTQIAAKEAGVAGFDDLLTGPTAIAFINGDVVEAAKGLRDFAKANPALVIKGGVLDGGLLDAQEVAKLADLESREV